MYRSSILLTLTLGIVAVQGRSAPRGNQYLGRNYNANSNTNVIGRSHYSHDEEADKETTNVREEIRRKLLAEGNLRAAPAATAAAEATQAVLRSMSKEISETAAVAVAEAVAQAVSGQASRSDAPVPRRSYNANMNTNIIGKGRSRASDGVNSLRKREYDDLGALLKTESPMVIDVPAEPQIQKVENDGTGNLGIDDREDDGNSNTNVNINTNYNTNANRYVDEDIEPNNVVDAARLGLFNDDEDYGSPLPYAGLLKTIAKGLPPQANRNVNSNTNTNALNRRSNYNANSNSNRLYRRNYNNANIHNFRRSNVNSNSNSNSRRSNVNYNSNSNSNRFRRNFNDDELFDF